MAVVESREREGGRGYRSVDTFPPYYLVWIGMHYSPAQKYFWVSTLAPPDYVCFDAHGPVGSAFDLEIAHRPRSGWVSNSRRNLRRLYGYSDRDLLIIRLCSTDFKHPAAYAHIVTYGGPPNSRVDTSDPGYAPENMFRSSSISYDEHEKKWHKPGKTPRKDATERVSKPLILDTLSPPSREIIRALKDAGALEGIDEAKLARGDLQAYEKARSQFYFAKIGLVKYHVNRTGGYWTLDEVRDDVVQYVFEHVFQNDCAFLAAYDPRRASFNAFFNDMVKKRIHDRSRAAKRSTKSNSRVQDELKKAIKEEAERTGRMAAATKSDDESRHGDTSSIFEVQTEENYAGREHDRRIEDVPEDSADDPLHAPYEIEFRNKVGRRFNILHLVREPRIAPKPTKEEEDFARMLWANPVAESQLDVWRAIAKDPPHSRQYTPPPSVDDHLELFVGINKLCIRRGKDRIPEAEIEAAAARIPNAEYLHRKKPREKRIEYEDRIKYTPSAADWMTPRDVIAQERETTQRARDIRMIRSGMALLSEHESIIVDLRAGSAGRYWGSFREIAAITDLHPSKCKRLWKSALKKLGDHVGVNGRTNAKATETGEARGVGSGSRLTYARYGVEWSTWRTRLVDAAEMCGASLQEHRVKALKDTFAALVFVDECEWIMRRHGTDEKFVPQKPVQMHDIREYLYVGNEGKEVSTFSLVRNSKNSNGSGKQKEVPIWQEEKSRSTSPSTS